LWKKVRPKRAAHWPIAPGHVELIEENRDSGGFLKVTLAYTYCVYGERYVGRETFTFLQDARAAEFERDFRGRAVLVHYKPRKPRVSVLSRQYMGQPSAKVLPSNLR
jgi:hypothetical protein